MKMLKNALNSGFMDTKKVLVYELSNNKVHISVSCSKIESDNLRSLANKLKGSMIIKPKNKKLNYIFNL